MLRQTDPILYDHCLNCISSLKVKQERAACPAEQHIWAGTDQVGTWKLSYILVLHFKLSHPHGEQMSLDEKWYFYASDFYAKILPQLPDTVNPMI